MENVPEGLHEDSLESAHGTFSSAHEHVPNDRPPLRCGPPLACLLLRAAWQSIAECLPTQVTARPSEPSPARPDSYPAGLDNSLTRSDSNPARLDLVSLQARPTQDTSSLSELSAPGVAA